MDNAAVDPRVRRTREAVTRAAVALMEEEGVSAITHQRVAERAGIGRATLYRHWPQPSDLVIDALAEREQPLLRYADRPLRPWLVDELRSAGGELGQPLAVHVMAALVSGAHLSPGTADLRAGIFARMVAPVARALRRAVAEGELAGEPDPAEFVAQTLGPVLFKVVIQGAPTTDAFIEHMVDSALAPWLPGVERQGDQGEVSSAR
jgi:AcrR family transcriptional regulator